MPNPNRKMTQFSLFEGLQKTGCLAFAIAPNPSSSFISNTNKNGSKPSSSHVVETSQLFSARKQFTGYGGGGIPGHLTAEVHYSKAASYHCINLQRGIRLTGVIESGPVCLLFKAEIYSNKYTIQL